MEDFIKKMIEAADAAGKELKVEISKEKESYRITPKKELIDQINHLQIQKNIIECKDFLDDADHELLSRINDEIKSLKEKLKKC